MRKFRYFYVNDELLLGIFTQENKKVFFVQTFVWFSCYFIFIWKKT